MSARLAKSILLILQILVCCESYTPKEKLRNINDVVNSYLKDNQNKPFGECQLCREFARSFNRGIETTSLAHDVTKGQSYVNSEDRFNDIYETVCDDLAAVKQRCLQFADEVKEKVRKWWFSERLHNVDLSLHLCIETIKVCCPKGTFGLHCRKCPGYPNRICSGNGICKGDGSRKGTGKCQCVQQYTGELCDQCAFGHYKESEVNSIAICRQCDQSCLGHCRGFGARNCEACRSGYAWEDDYGCLDIDECVESPTSPCNVNSFCVNTEGSFHCYECDKSCAGCTGDGPDMCVECADDYQLKNGVCIDATNQIQEQNLELSRYATYLGLSFATCVILSKNVGIASIIGLIVALYIGVAEYTIHDHDTPHPLYEVYKYIFG